MSLTIGRSARAASPNWTVWVCALLGFGAYAIVRPDFPFLQTDSGSYIDFAPIRTAAYPLFLKAVRAVFGDLYPAAYLQLGLMTAATGYLGTEVRAATRSTLAGVGTVALVLANAYIMRYAFSIMTEGPFFAGVALTLALACRFARLRTAASLAWLSAAIGLCVLIRPIGYAFLPVLPLCALFAGRTVMARAAAAVAPVSCALAIGATSYFAYHGNFKTQSFLGHNLIGKIAFIPGDGVRSEYQPVVDRIDRAMADLRSVQVENLRDRYLYRESHYDYVRYGLTTPLVDRMAEQRRIRPDNLRQEVAWAFIKAHPRDYAAEVALQAYSLWQLGDLRTPAEKKAFDRLIGELPFDPFGKVKFLPRKPAPALFVYGIRAFLALAFAASLMAPALVAWRIVRRRPVSPSLLIAAQTSVLLNGYFLGVALIQFGHTRYFMVMWPAVIVLAVTSCAAVISLCRDNRSCLKHVARSTR